MPQLVLFRLKLFALAAAGITAAKKARDKELQNVRTACHRTLAATEIHAENLLDGFIKHRSPAKQGAEHLLGLSTHEAGLPLTWQRQGSVDPQARKDQHEAKGEVEGDECDAHGDIAT